MHRKWNSAAVLVASLSVLSAFAAGGSAAAAAPATAPSTAPTPPRPRATQKSAAAAAAATTGFPATPPVQICGKSILNGPAVQPAGSVGVDPGQSLYDVTQAHPAGTTFWLSPGTFTLGMDPYNQVVPKNNDTFIGAPGAVLDGQGINRYAFTAPVSGVTIEYLTVQNFAAPQDEASINHDFGANWTIKYNTFQYNYSEAVNAGNNSVFQYNCITANGQTGINGVQGTTTVTIDHNEISFNDTGRHAAPYSCGCSGNVKLFGVADVTLTNNWVHDGGNVGLWGDTNALGWLIENNYLNDNYGEAIVFETSYNAYIHNNNMVHNTIGKGSAFLSRLDSFPVTAVYISESGGDKRVYGGKYATLEISGNNFDNNWGGVTLWEDANRFCASIGNTAPGFCPIVGAASTANCVAGTISNPPYFSDCRWLTQNVLVDHNIFRTDTEALGCVHTRCSENAIFSNTGTTPSWSPYLNDEVQKSITFHQNNHFVYNTYVGDWNFDIEYQGYEVNWATWRSGDTNGTFNQDAGSTLTPLPRTNALDSDTSTIEGSIGHWQPSFNSTIAQSTAQAHSGTHSLQANVTGTGGWGVQLNNAPYFPSQPGAKVLSFWGMTTSGGSPGTTMQVTWRDNMGTLLQTDNVTIPALTSAWQQGSTLADAPAGTAYAGVTLYNQTGVAGSTIYLDDMLVAENALDTDTSTIEGSTGHWVPWFNSAVAQSNAQAHSGGHSLQVNIKASGWGVTLNNAYVPETPGTKTLSFWARAGSGSGLTAILQATWRDAYGNILQTDKVTSPPVTSSWQQAVAVVTAPPGTENVGLDLYSFTGGNGDSLLVDDVVVVNGVLQPVATPPPPSPNIVDPDTATLENSIGQWQPWFSSAVAQSTAQAHGGTHSLQVNVTAPNGWGVTLKNYPFFPTSPGPKTISFWALAGSGTGLSANMQVVWLSSAPAILRTDTVSIPTLTGSWQQASAAVTAPSGAATAQVNLYGMTGASGNVVYFDDIYVGT